MRAQHARYPQAADREAQRFEPSASIEVNHALTLPSIDGPESHGQWANRIGRADELCGFQRSIVERLQRTIAEIPFTYAGSDIKVTASFGVAWLIAASDTAELLLSRADAALYGAKHAGRNRVEYAATG